MDALSLNGKKALITGGGKGLGAAIAQTFANAGAKIAIIGRTLSDLEKTAERIGPKCLPIRADISNPDDVRAMFTKLKEAFDGLDLLINNAAVFPLYKVEEANDEELQTSVNVNLLGPLYTIRGSVPLMRKCGGSIIVNISTQTVVDPSPFLSVYAATKAGLEVLSDGMRNELRPDNIRVITFRVGRMNSGTTDLAGRDKEKMERFMIEMEQVGKTRNWRDPMPVDQVAQTLLSLVTLPKMVGTETIVLKEI